MKYLFSEVVPMTDDTEYILKTLLEQSRVANYPSLAQDKYFEIFSAHQSLKAQHFNPDPTEIESGIVGGNGDGGVDGFYLFVNKKFIREDTDTAIFKEQQLNIEVIIVQGKNKASFEESVPMKLSDFTERCFRLNADHGTCQLYSDSLLTLVKKFHAIYIPAITFRPALNINFFHVTLGDHIDSKVKTRAELLEQQVKQSFPTSECHYNFIGGRALIDLYYQQPESTLLLPIRDYFDYQSFNKTAFVCIVSLPDYYDFIRDSLSLREYMFEANVRDHAPDAAVNKAIRATLAVPQNDDFWWLNNGITILASDVSYTGSALRLTDPLVVNGLQTSHEVFDHFVKGALFRDNRSIMVKVIKNIDAETSDRIIRATNSQTKIESINLHASEQIHRDIETALQNVDLFYDRRKNFYLNKGVSASKVITIGYMAQAITAIVLQQPNNARARPTTVADKNYSKLFSDAYPIQLYPKCAQVMKRVDSYLDERGFTQGAKLNLVFYLGMYATYAALKTAKPNPTRISSFDMSLLTDSLLDECYAWLSGTFARLGDSDTTAKGPTLAEALKERINQEYGRAKNVCPF